jgi:putative ABC transport system permease protein
LAQSFPESVRDVIRNRRDTVETTRYTAVDAPGVPGPPGTTRLLTLEYVQGAADRVRLVSGRMPEEREEIVPLPFRLGQPRAPLVEVAIPLAAANQLSLQAGDVLYLEPDFEDVLAGAVPLSERRMIAAEVTGIFSPKTDADAAWLDDARLGAAVTRDTDQRRYVYGFGLFAPSAYGEVADASAPLPLRYTWRYDVDPSGFDAGTIDRVDSDVRKLDASFGESTFGQRLGTGVRTGLSEVLTDYRSDRDAAAAVIAIGAVGLLALALAVVALLGGLAANRRRESIALVRSRGGASWQVLGAEAVEGIAVALPAGLVGYVLALVLLDGRSVVRRPAASWPRLRPAPPRAASLPAGGRRSQSPRCRRAGWRSRRRSSSRRSSASTSYAGAGLRTRTASTPTSPRCHFSSASPPGSWPSASIRCRCGSSRRRPRGGATSFLRSPFVASPGSLE